GRGRPGMPLHVEIVAAERLILDGEADEVVADTASGEIGILPRHAPLLTLLVPGVVRLRRQGAGGQIGQGPGDETVLAIGGGGEPARATGGGFLEVSQNEGAVLADSAERADEIDVARAEEARRRASERLRTRTPEVDQERARAALLRSVARLRAVEQVRRRSG